MHLHPRVIVVALVLSLVTCIYAAIDGVTGDRHSSTLCDACAFCQGAVSDPPKPAAPDAAPRADVRDAPAPDAVVVENGIALYFSPNGGCTTAIVREIEGARKEVKVQAYRLTSVPIAKALVDAHNRGVSVTIILDRTQKSTKYSDATFFFNHKVPVHIDSRHAIAHNKVVLIDGETIITGSFNFSAAAEERNSENLLIIKEHPKLAAEYDRNFTDHLGHSSAYEGIVRLPDRTDDNDAQPDAEGRP